MLARGIHRSVVSFLVLALLLGVGAGVALHMGLAAGHRVAGFVCLGLGLLAAVGPLAWMASFRIAWPLRELAEVASEIRSGRLKSRDELPRATGEVGEVAEALGAVTDRVARQLRDQRALMAAVSHELRSPLGRARVLVELARDGGAPATYDELQGEIDAMDALVGDLLAAARIDFEALNPVEIDAAELARRAVEVARLPAATVVLDQPAGSVWVDPTLLTRALAGLLDNARRYGGTHIALHVRGRRDRVRFEVLDDGPGFGAHVSEAFQPFWRAPAPEGVPLPRGEGLGLALVRQIAEAHGGEAGAENRPEGGARVWVEVGRGAGRPREAAAP